VCIVVPSRDYGVVEDAAAAIGHALACTLRRTENAPAAVTGCCALGTERGQPHTPGRAGAARIAARPTDGRQAAPYAEPCGVFHLIDGIGEPHEYASDAPDATCIVCGQSRGAA